MGGAWEGVGGDGTIVLPPEADDLHVYSVCRECNDERMLISYRNTTNKVEIKLSVHVEHEHTIVSYPGPLN